MKPPKGNQNLAHLHQHSTTLCQAGLARNTISLIK